MHRHPDTETLSTAVIAGIASQLSVEPTDLDTPLFEAINPEALDTLFRDSTGAVTFRYENYDVTVHSDGRVEWPTDSETPEKATGGSQVPSTQ